VSRASRPVQKFFDFEGNYRSGDLPGGAILDNVAMSTSNSAQAPSFSATEFRAALGSFATGVAIVTARDVSGRLVGLTVNSFNSVSLVPPLVLWSLALKARSMQTFSETSNYAIHILAADQLALAERFSQKEGARFEGVSFRDSITGVPILEGALAVFECFNRSQYEEGDHVIFVGEVERCTLHADAQPLIFQRGKFFSRLSETSRTSMDRSDLG
jgi:flavin reductase (DIM6/NTAB) family NADH-FMN oxidoreductase RutF